MDEQLTVLVAAEDGAFRDLCGRWLGSHDLRLAADGREAMAQFDDAVDVACLDREMPGPSGVDLATDLDPGPDCSVVLMSMVPGDVDLSATPVDRCVRKPVGEETVRRIVGRHRKRQRYRRVLEELFELTRELSDIDPDETWGSPEAARRCVTLQRRIAEKREELDEILRDGGSDWVTAFRSLQTSETAEAEADA